MIIGDSPLMIIILTVSINSFYHWVNDRDVENVIPFPFFKKYQHIHIYRSICMIYNYTFQT